MAEKTMNTLLHVFEAYTELYRVTKDPFTGDRLRFMMDLFADKVYNKEKRPSGSILRPDMEYAD